MDWRSKANQHELVLVLSTAKDRPCASPVVATLNTYALTQLVTPVPQRAWVVTPTQLNSGACDVKLPVVNGTLGPEYAAFTWYRVVDSVKAFDRFDCAARSLAVLPVSYTHLDVYKRQSPPRLVAGLGSPTV